MAEERPPDKGPDSAAAISRRQFLVGAGAGAVVGAAGAATALTVARRGAAVEPTAGGLEFVAQDERLITLSVNGKSYKVVAKSRATLSDVIRYQLGLTGTHIGCNRAECGACTVAMDGKNIYSCTQMAWASEGHEITTIEGLATNTSSLEGLHPLQRAFAVNDAGQCNFCIPGQIMSAYSLLLKTPSPTAAQVQQHLSGNICRCGNYQNIVKSVLVAADEWKGGPYA